jgi:hypothetical protein
MSDKLPGGVTAGSVDVSIPVLLRAAATNSETTGVAAAAVTASYWRQGGLRTAISVSALASVAAVHSDGGWIQVDALNLPGVYRLDLPDAALAPGADWLVVSVVVPGSFAYHERLNLGVTPADIVRINGGRTDGYHASLKLKALEVVNDSDTAVILAATGGNGLVVTGDEGAVYLGGTGGSHALELNTTGAGIGLKVNGGTTGKAVQLRGGTSSGPAVDVAATSGHGLTIVGGGPGFADLDAQFAPDALDAIAVAAPAGPAANFRQMIVQLWRRFFKKATASGTQLHTYADDGTTVVTTQSLSDDGTTETQGPAT